MNFQRGGTRVAGTMPARYTVIRPNQSRRSSQYWTVVAIHSENPFSFNGCYRPAGAGTTATADSSEVAVANTAATINNQLSARMDRSAKPLARRESFHENN